MFLALSNVFDQWAACPTHLRERLTARPKAVTVAGPRHAGMLADDLERIDFSNQEMTRFRDEGYTLNLSELILSLSVSARPNDFRSQTPRMNSTFSSFANETLTIFTHSIETTHRPAPSFTMQLTLIDGQKDREQYTSN